MQGPPMFRNMFGPGARRGGLQGPGVRAIAPLTSPPSTTVQGVNCELCKQAIQGQVLQAGGRLYHPEHFWCHSCAKPLKGNPYIFGKDGNVYCDWCFSAVFSIKCGACDMPVRLSDAVNAGGKHFHKEHFVCLACGTNLAEKRYKLRENSPYCTACAEITGGVRIPTCAYCNAKIVGPFLKIQGKDVHPSHYHCTECGKAFDEDCHEFEGDLYCTQHYEKILLRKCAACKKPCKKPIMALGQTWHPEHFTCHVCHVPLSNSFFEHDGVPYCETHFRSGSNDTCEFCKEEIISSKIVFFDKKYHENHFLCCTCDSPLKNTEFTHFEQKPMCKTCYRKLPIKIRKNRRKIDKKKKKEKEKEEKGKQKEKEEKEKGKKKEEEKGKVVEEVESKESEESEESEGSKEGSVENKEKSE